MKRRDFMKAAGAAAGTAALRAGEREQPMAGGDPKRPNIVVYITDEQRADCVGAYGNEVIQTPNMDRLAASGARFNQFFSQFPLCGPSRACFLTGQYPQTHGVYFNGVPVPAYSPRIPRTLREAGYRTAQVGLYNVEPREGEPHGFDIFRFQSAEYPAWAAGRGVTDIYPYGGEPRPKGYYGAVDYPPEAHAASWVAEVSCGVLEQVQDGPFYLEINERYPHLPYVAPEPYASMYDPEEVPIAPSVPRDREDFQAIKEMHAVYYGMISLVDYNFGRILDKLEELGLADNTVVVFTTDHGDMIGHHNLWSKWALYDDDARLPFIIRYPGQPEAGRVIDGLAEQIDLFPTLMELAGAETPRGVQGRSLLPLIEDGAPGRDAVFASQGYGDYPARIRDPRQMVRTKDWKLIHMPGNESLMFDLKNDPYEMNNLYGDPGYAQVERELKDRLLEWRLASADTTIPSLFIPGQREEAEAWIDKYVRGV